MMAQMIGGVGFVAALDQSGGSTPNALKNYGLSGDAYEGEEDMFALIHQMRSRIVTAPSFNGRKVLGAILFEKAMDGDIDGKPVPSLLWERGVVPFVKVDQGLEDENDGVQRMKPNPVPRSAARARQGKGCVWHENAICDQQCVQKRDRGCCRPAIRHRQSYPRHGFDADCRAGSEHQEQNARRM